MSNRTPRRLSRSRATSSRRGRLLLAAVPVGAALALTLGGVANGAVPVSFSISGEQFQVGASKLDGQNFSQYAGTAIDTAGNERDVAIANIGTATLADLCQSVTAETPLGTVGLKISAGGGGTPASATDMQIGMTDLKGDASFTDIRIGVDASTVRTEARGTAGGFAQDSETITIDGLQQTAWSVHAGVFTLPGMTLALTDGTDTCF